MIRRNGLFILLVMTVLFAACQKSANNSPYPQITFKYLTPDSVAAASPRDTVYLGFDYTDGDGDLGNPGHNPASYIYLIDSRDTSMKQNYPFPDVTDAAAHDPQYGMSGSCLVLIQAATLIPRSDTLHTNQGDTVQFTTYIVDEAGHESNRFLTPKIYIRPH